MKRYSVSMAYGREGNKVNFQYWGRADDPKEMIDYYKLLVSSWEAKVLQVSDKKVYYDDNYKGMRITDSQTKKVVFEDVRFPEDYGYRMERGEGGYMFVAC